MVNKFTKMLLVLVVILSVALGVVLYAFYDKYQQVTVTLTGDILYESNFQDWYKKNSMEDYFDGIEYYMQSSIVIGNQVQPVSKNDTDTTNTTTETTTEESTEDTTEEVTEYSEYMTEVTTEDGTEDTTEESSTNTVETTPIQELLPSLMAKATKKYDNLGYTFMTNATYNSMDKGVEGIKYTNKLLDKSNVGHTGTFTSKAKRNTLSIVEKNGIKIAILSYTAGTYQQKEANYNVNCFTDNEGYFDEDHRNQLKNDVEDAKEQADAVFVSLSWGDEYTYDINDNQIEVTNFLTNLGVDLIIGNHPHISQKAEILTNEDGHQTVVFYSLGSLTSAHIQEGSSDEAQNMLEVSSLVQLEVSKEDDGASLSNIKVIPIVNHFEAGYKNFQLIPLGDYTDKKASKHYVSQYNSKFNISWIKKQLKSLYGDTGFLTIEETPEDD